ncbi:MAG: accessory gene regulator ArgB-like protein [Eubacteriales bacterium]
MPRPLIYQRSAEYLQRQLGLSAMDTETAAFALEAIASITLPLAAIAMAGWLFGCLAVTLTVLFASYCIRFFAGGAHCSSLSRCTLLGALVTGVLGRMAASSGPSLPQAYLLAFTTAATATAMITCWRLAPLDSPAKPVNNPVVRHQIRVLAVAAAAVTGILALTLSVMAVPIGSPYALAIGFAQILQSFILTRAGNRFVDFMDKLLDFKWKEVN